ncbi:MAG: hypothetical protein WA414_16710, partial [Acidobacteriaceae bacterium]
MFRRIPWLLALLLAVGCVARLYAQDRNDPLTDDEVNQIRDSKIHPDERIRLYIKFIGERLDAVRQLTADRHAPDSKAQIRDKLEEFTNLCDELQDNIETYDEAHADIRKSLKDLVAATNRWPDTLHAVPPDPSYEFSEKTALDAAQS